MRGSRSRVRGFLEWEGFSSDSWEDSWPRVCLCVRLVGGFGVEVVVRCGLGFGEGVGSVGDGGLGGRGEHVRIRGCLPTSRVLPQGWGTAKLATDHRSLATNDCVRSRRPRLLLPEPGGVPRPTNPVVFAHRQTGRLRLDTSHLRSRDDHSPKFDTNFL